MQKVSGDRIREALAQLVFFSKYARYNPELKRRETYEEAIERMLAMHVTFYGDVIKADLPFVRQALLERMILPSGRAMQFAGPAILKKHTRIFNCSFSHCDRPRFFAEAMWLLLCGCGTGFSVQRQHVAKLPGLVRPGGEPQTHVVADSIEGWADAADALIRSYLTGFHGPEESWIQPPVRFDYSQVRPEGSPLSSSSGKAPGPKPLRDALEAVRGLLDALEGTRLRPIDCYDIVMHLSGAVLAGGVRRSATICLFSADDEEMMNAKTSDWFTTNPQRSRSNNSAVLLRGHTPRETFDNLIKSTKEMGEPGFLFVDDLEQGTNPCQPGFAPVYTPEGVRTFDAIEVGSKVWSKDGFVTVVRKVASGVKPVFAYVTSHGTFFGTANHRVCQDGLKVPAGEATHIDPLALPDQRKTAYYAPIVARVFLGEMPVFDITVDGPSHTYWTDGLSVSNCGEISLFPTLGEESGWSFCNLTSVNFAACNSQTKAFQAARAAAILGTWQAGYTEPGYLGETSRRINERDALLGVSLTGMADAPHLAFNEQLQVQMANIVKQANMETAAKLGIRAAARTTCVKPEGTQSLVVKAGNGIHPHHDEDYIRHVQFNVNEEPVKHFLKSNPHAVFKSPYREGDVVVAFPVSVSEGAWIKKQTTALGHLQMVLDTQKAWVETGTNRGKSHHNVSNTILVREDEWEGVADFLWHHQTHFAGVSLLPASGDLDYQLAPFVALRDLDGRVRPVQQQKFEDLLDAWQDVDYTQMHEEEDVTKPLDLVACGGGSCSI